MTGRLGPFRSPGLRSDSLTRRAGFGANTGLGIKTGVGGVFLIGGKPHHPGGLEYPVAHGASRKFEDTILCHLDVVYRMARTLSRDSNEADDLVQETFLRAHKAFEKFDLRECGAKPWLMKILHNVFLTRRGQTSRQPLLQEDMRFEEIATEIDQPDVSAIDFSRFAQDHFDDQMYAALRALAPQYRTVLMLWAVGDLSYKEIGDVLGVAMGTVMSRLFRARQMLAESLAEYATQRGFGKQQGGSA